MKKLLFIFLIVPLMTFSQNTGLNFDGNGDYIRTAFNGIAGGSSRTVQCWFKGNFSSNQRFFVDMGNLTALGSRFSFKINPSSSVARIEIAGGGLDGNANIRDGIWHQLTVTYDSSLTSNQYKIYVDGIFDAQGNISAANLNTPATSASPMTIGIRTDLNSTTDVTGDMDEVRIWNYALSPAEITGNWNKEICGIPTGLVAYYKMNEGTAGGTNTAITSLIDEITPLSTNTLTGFSKTGTSSNYIIHTLAGGGNNTTINPTFCSGTYTSPNGQIFSAPGTYADSLTASNGCDSIITINLTYIPSRSNVSATACDNYTWAQNGITYSTSGNYYDTITGSGCDSVVTLSLTINTLNAGSIGVVSGYLAVVSAGNKYQWLDCANGNTPVSAADTNQTFTPIVNGLYACKVTNALGCSDTTPCFSYNSVSINSLLNEINWSIYPNPTSGNITINLPENNSLGTIKIYNTSGQLLQEIDINRSNTQLDLNELSNGIYQIVYSMNRFKSTKSLVINK